MAKAASQPVADWSKPDPGNKPDAKLPPSQHPNPDAVDHAQIGSSDKKEGGKDMGLVDPPIVSMNPTSEPQGDADAEIGEHRIVDNANLRIGGHYLMSDYKFNYPFETLEFGQGMFIPVEENSTTDKLMAKIYKQVDQYRKQNSEIERDENGDDVMEDVAINVKLRNEDGTVQLDGDKPRLSIKSGFRPKLVGPSFIVKPVVKGDKITAGDDGEEADSDGALVIRLA